MFSSARNEKLNQLEYVGDCLSPKHGRLNGQRVYIYRYTRTGATCDQRSDEFKYAVLSIRDGETAPNAFGHVGRRSEYLIDTFYHCDISEIDPDKHTPARPLPAESLEGHRPEGKLGIEQKKNLHLKWEYGLLMLNYFQHYLRARMIMPHKLPLEAANALAILIATFVLKS